MKKLLVISLFLSLYSSAQNVSGISRSLKDSSEVYVESFHSAHYGSTKLNNAMTKALILGGHLDNNLIESISQRSGTLHTIGAEIVSGTYAFLPQLKLFGESGTIIGFQHNTSIGLNFSDDLFDLVFKGNAHVIGDTLNFTGTSLHFRNANTLSIGLNKNNKSKFLLNFTGYVRNDFAKVEKGLFYTDSITADLTTSLYGNFNSNQGANLTSAGMGISLSYETVFPLIESWGGDTTQKLEMQLGVQNLGMIIPIGNSKNQFVNKDFTYTGIEINSITEIQSSLISSESIIDTFGIETTNINTPELTPYEIYLNIIPKNTRRAFPLGGFHYRNASNFNALFYLGAGSKVSEHLILKSYVMHGGYEKLRLGVSAEIVSDKFQFSLFSNNFTGLLLKSFYGQAIGVNLTYKL